MGFMVEIRTSRPSYPSSPTGSTITTASSSSNKENIPPDFEFVVPTPPPSLATPPDSPSSHMEQDDPADSNAERQNQLTYDRFVSYCKDADRRADLYEEVKERSFSAALPLLLRLFHTTGTNSELALRLGQAIGYSSARVKRLADDLGGLATLVWNPDRPRLNTLIRGFVDQSRNVGTQIDFDTYLTSAFQLEFDIYRKEIFDILVEFGLESAGHCAFVKHGYVGSGRWGMTEEAWQGEGDQIQRQLQRDLSELARITEEAIDEARLWHDPPCEDDHTKWESPPWRPAPKDKINNDWIDPQEPRP